MGLPTYVHKLTYPAIALGDSVSEAAKRAVKIVNLRCLASGPTNMYSTSLRARGTRVSIVDLPTFILELGRHNYRRLS
jgi:hypothetical protein